MTKIKEGYKETEMGVIPEDWGLTCLEKVSEFITKGATPTTYGYEWQDEGIYFFKSDLFINIFGNDFFYRINRLLDWRTGSGMQLTNALTAISSAGIFGFGFNHTPIYFPEAHTDFIFSVYASNFGLIGSILLLTLLIYFDLRLVNIAVKSNININKYIMAGILGMLLYQQIQSIGMNLGLLPITGITLPFISYGGSSLLSYMIMAGLIFNLSNASIRYRNFK
jgi:rod shape determining protein RodA